MRPFLFFLICGAATAQQASIDGPSSGFFFDQLSGSIRRIIGVPGSAVFGPAVVDGVSFASIAPAGKLALIRRPAEGFSLLRLSGPVSIEPLADLADGDLVIWAQDASAAVLYSKAAGQFQRIRLLSARAEADQAQEAQLPAGEITALAIDSGAKNIVVGIRSPEVGGVYLLQPSRPALRVAALDDPAAMVFDASGRRLFVADRQSHRIVELRNFGPAPEVVQISQEPERALVSMALSTDGRQLFVTASEPNTLLVFDTDSQQKLTEISLMMEPLELSGLAEKAIFLLRTRTQTEEPLWILDTRRLQASVYFVPPGEVRE
jgi:hypothetical protein